MLLWSLNSHNLKNNNNNSLKMIGWLSWIFLKNKLLILTATSFEICKTEFFKFKSTKTTINGQPTLNHPIPFKSMKMQTFYKFALIFLISIIFCASQKPFTALDNHKLKRVGAPVASPSGKFIVYTVRQWVNFESLSLIPKGFR